MQKKVSLGITMFSVLFAVVLTFTATFAGTSAWVKSVLDASQTQEEASDESEEKQNATTAEVPDTLSEVQYYYENIYIGELDEDEINDYIITGYVAGTGDKYGHYYNAEEYESLKEDMEGDMQGIGVTVTYNGDYNAIEVISVFPDSPAEKAGVQVGDLIMYVGSADEDDDTLTSVAALGYNAAVKALQGLADTTARFVVYRGTNYEEQVAFEIVRDYVTEQTVTGRLYSLDETVGIIRITGFDTKTVTQFSEAVESLTSKGATKLVFDVRNNPGGELNSICSILDTLLPEGPVIRTIDKAGTEKTIYESDAEELDMPMAVLVNGKTASAAELFTSALKDYDKAVIVGTNTYGKGCMQTIFPLSNGGCISLTSALYCPPFSDNYDGEGIVPDVECELSEEASQKNIFKLTDEEDNQLAAAVETFAD